MTLTSTNPEECIQQSEAFCGNELFINSSRLTYRVDIKNYDKFVYKII